LQSFVNRLFTGRAYQSAMDVSGAKLPLSAVYLNLLQTRPVSPVAAVGRVAAPTTSHVAAPDANGAAERTAAGGRAQPRGRFVDILV
jgi:hypothetical protein